MRTQPEIERALEVMNTALSYALTANKQDISDLVCVALCLEWALGHAEGQHFQDTLDACNQRDAAKKRMEKAAEN